MFNKDVLLIVSLFAELVRLFGVLIIALSLRSSGSKAANISLMSQKFYLVVFGTRLVFKLFYEDFDFIYVVVESLAFVATGEVASIDLELMKEQQHQPDNSANYATIMLTL